MHRALQGAVLEQGRALLGLERDRLDALQAILWPLAEKGDVRAARELVRLMERRGRVRGMIALLSIDSPVRTPTRPRVWVRAPRPC